MPSPMNKERRITIAIAAIFVILPLQYLINRGILTASGHPTPHLKSILKTAFNFSFLAVAGVILGVVFSAIRREFRLHLRVLLQWRWIATTLLLIFCVAVIGFEYGVLKITVHLVRRETFDALLWEIDRWLMFGVSPNVFFLEALSHPVFYRVFDWLYAFAFGATMAASFALMFGWRHNDDRIGYLAGSAVLWLGGAWLYLAVPSLGPTYAFYGVWDTVREHFPTTMAIQKMLLNNHLRVLRLAGGEKDLAISVHMGIAAFPSLHVAFHAYFAFWLQRLVPAVRLVGWLLVGVVFVGSVITGWHYMIDSIAGLLLAWLAWRVGAWVAGPKTARAPAPPPSSVEAP
jgi:hypothetical protein